MRAVMRGTHLAVVAALFLAACGSKSQPAKVTEEERVRSKEAKVGEARQGSKFQEKRDAQHVGRLCEALVCDDAQRTALGQLIASGRSGADYGGARRGPNANTEANAALADAFSQDSLDVQALRAYHTATTGAGASPSEDKGSQAKLAAALVAFHATLSAAQRTTMATFVTDNGLDWLTRARGPQAAGGKPLRSPDPQRRAERIAGRLCKELGCAAAQESTLATALVGLSPERGEASKAAKTTLAAAIGSEALSASAVEAFFAEQDTLAAATHTANDAVWLSIHAALDSEQRATLATMIRERGMLALGGGRARRMGQLGAAR